MIFSGVILKSFTKNDYSVIIIYILIIKELYSIITVVGFWKIFF